MTDEPPAIDVTQPSDLPARPPLNRIRLVVILTVILALFGGVGYFAWGASVRSSSEQVIRDAAQSLLKGNPAAARDHLKWLLWFEPEHPTALHLAGMSYLKQDNLPAARQCLDRIPEDSSVHENAQSLLAGALLADQQFDNAEDVLLRILKRHPKSAISCRQLSGLWLTELRSREAVRILEDYLRQRLKGPIVLSDLQFLLRDLGSAEFLPPGPQDCIESLQKSLERHPNQHRVQLALANCYVRLGKLDEAEPLLQAAGQHGGHEPDYRFVESEFWLVKGDVERAGTALPGSSAAPESDDRYWELRCRISEFRDDNQRALSDIDQALSLRPFTKEYESRRARLLQKLRRAEESRNVYDRSHEFAKSELELWRLTRDLGTRSPTSAECEHVAQLYESLGKKLQAGAWRRLCELLAKDAPGK
jgi:predicted Zn-dependent protease